MLFTYNLKDKLFNPLEESSFKSLDIFERRDLERWNEDVLISDSVNIMKELYLFLKPKIDNLK